MYRKRVKKKTALFIMVFAAFIGIMNAHAYAGGFTNEVTRNSSYDRNKATWYAENYATCAVACTTIYQILDTL